MLWFLAAAVLGATMAPVSVDDAVEAALQHDPLLAEAEAELEAAEGDLRGSRGIQYNPEAQVGVLFGDPQQAGGPRVEGQLMQPIPVSGEAVHAARSATARIDAARARLQRERFETAARARRAFLRRLLAEIDLRIAEQEMSGAASLREAAQARFDAGDAPLLDVQLARLEEAGAVATWLESDAEARAARVSFAALTGLPVDGPAVGDPLDAAPRIDGAGPEMRSDMAAALSAVDSARAAVARERTAGLPPLEVGVFFEADVGQAAVGPRLTLPLPFRNQNLRGLGAARGQLGLAEAAAASAGARAEAEQSGAAGNIEATERAGVLLGDELPAAEAALDAVQQGYEVGEFDIAQVLLLRARIIEGERGWYRARAAIAAARIDVALARELPSLLVD